MKEKIKRLATVAFAFIGSGVFALADSPVQDGKLDQALTKGADTFIKYGQTVIRYAEIICVIAGVVSIAWALMDRDNRQEAQNQRILKVGVGLIIAFVVLLILSAVLQALV